MDSCFSASQICYPLRGQQGHDPLPALRAHPGEIDRTHREVPRKGSRRAQECHGGHIEAALTPVIAVETAVLHGFRYVLGGYGFDAV